MGAWDVQPWDNDEAADWFGDFFAGVNFDERLDAVFDDSNVDYETDQVRAACYILQVLGRIYVWQGDVNRLGSHLDRGIRHLQRMVDPADEICQELQEMWGDDSEVFDSIKAQISELQARRSEGNWDTAENQPE